MTPPKMKESRPVAAGAAQDTATDESKDTAVLVVKQDPCTLGVTQPPRRTRKPRGGSSNDHWPGGYASLPRVFFETAEFRALSPPARSLLIEYCLRFKGRNNGNLEMTEEQFAIAGLGTPTTFRRYNTELINAGWIMVTRQGGLGRCNLYALTYLHIDNTGIQYDHPIKAGSAPLHLWSDENQDRRDIRRKPRQRNRLNELPQRKPRRPNRTDGAPQPDVGQAPASSVSRARRVAPHGEIRRNSRRQH